MAHDRPRHVSEKFRTLLRYSPIVGVFGHRQVGKSTFISKEIPDYLTLDDVDSLDRAARDPKAFVVHARNRTLAIDECQLEPRLFPSLKERVRTDKRPGQFVLSGSVRFTSRKAIRESLAGRMAMVEMLPLTVAELSRVEPLAPVVELLKVRSFSTDSARFLRNRQDTLRLERGLEQYLLHGGLPGLCFIRNAVIKRRALEDLHDLILARDLRLVSDLRTPTATLKRLLTFIARHPFEIYNTAEVRRQLGLAPATQRSILEALEAVFFIRRIAIPRRNKWTYLLEDQFEEQALAGTEITGIRSVETALYRNLRTQFEYSLDQPVWTESYLTRDNARVPIVFRSSEQVLGIMLFQGEKPSLSDTRSGSSFLKNHGSAKIIYASSGRIPAHTPDERTLICSAAALL